jgi:hypothetical protein
MSQAALKKEMLNELKQKKQQTKDDLDKRYSKEGQGGPYPTEQEVGKLAAELGGEEQVRGTPQSKAPATPVSKEEALKKYGEEMVIPLAAERVEVEANDEKGAGSRPADRPVPKQAAQAVGGKVTPTNKAQDGLTKQGGNSAEAKQRPTAEVATPSGAGKPVQPTPKTESAPRPDETPAPEEEKITNSAAPSSSRRKELADMPPKVAQLVEQVMVQEEQLELWRAELAGASDDVRKAFDDSMRQIQAIGASMKKAGNRVASDPSKAGVLMPAVEKECAKTGPLLEKCRKIVELAKTRAKSAQ